MNKILVDKKKLKELEKQKEICLNFLYYVEDIFGYKDKVISNCIDELQYNLEFGEIKTKRERSDDLSV